MFGDVSLIKWSPSLRRQQRLRTDQREKNTQVSIPTCHFVLPMHIDLLQPSLLFCWLSKGPLLEVNRCTGGDGTCDMVALGSPMSACVRGPVPFIHLLPWAVLARQPGYWTRGSTNPTTPHVSHTFPRHPQTSSDQHLGAQRSLNCPNAIRVQKRSSRTKRKNRFWQGTEEGAFFRLLALLDMRFVGLSHTLDSKNLPSCFYQQKVAFKFFLGYIWLLLFELADAPRPCHVSWVLAGLLHTREMQGAFQEADGHQTNMQ